MARGLAPLTVAPELRNVTAVAIGAGSIALRFSAGENITLNGRLVNVIARGTAGDVVVETAGMPLGTATIEASHSNLAAVDDSDPQGTLVDTGGNQTALPLFGDAAAGDFRQGPGSPTIEAGLSHPLNGPFDLAGAARQLGATTDIGAYEADVAQPAPGPDPGPPVVPIDPAPSAVAACACAAPTARDPAARSCAGAAPSRSTRARAPIVTASKAA